MLRVNAETEYDRINRYYRNEASVVEMPLRCRVIKRVEYKDLLGQYWDLDMYRVIWQILWETGMRPLEACWLQLGNIDLVDKLIVYKISKPVTRDGVKYYKSRVVPISDDLSCRLSDFIEMNRLGLRNGFLFPSFKVRGKHPHVNPRTLNREMDRVRGLLGGRWLDKTSHGDHLISPHAFRRSWIVRYLDRYSNPADCCRAIGHSNIQTTFGYYQEIKEDRLRSFVDGSCVVVNVPSLCTDQVSLKAFV